MNSHDARVLAIRLFGLYWALQAVVYFSYFLPQLFDPAYESIGLVYHLSIGAQILVFGVVAWVCLAKTSIILPKVFSDEPEEESNARTLRGPCSLSFWVSIVALYVLVDSSGYIVSGIFNYLFERFGASGFYMASEFWAAVIQLLIALILLTWAREVEHAITGRNEIAEEDRMSAGQDSGADVSSEK